MENELEEFCAIANVGGAFVCDNRGDVIVSSSPAVLASVTMSAIGREVGRSFLAMEAAQRRATRMELKFDSWRLLAQDMGQAVLCVVCETGADLSLVRMTADVVTTAWAASPKVRRRLAAHQSERRQLMTPTTLEQGALHAWKLIQSQ